MHRNNFRNSIEIRFEIASNYKVEISCWYNYAIF